MKVVQTPDNETPLLSLKGITKHFGGTAALDNVDFNLHCGEIHALLGENGAGKSTLINVLGGIHTPDSGTILIDGQVVQIRNTSDANRYGISIIHQELSLAPNLSIAENIYLGREPGDFLGINHRRMSQQARELVMSLGLEEIQAVDTTVSQLSMAHQQLVEITRALSCRGRILVLDEPTSSLSESETEALFVRLRQLRSQGVGIIYISHRLEEIIRLSDRITVLRDGRSVGTQLTSDVNKQQLIRWMIGREITEHFHRPAGKKGHVAMQVRNLCNSNVHDVSFDLHYGEILGIAGLVGAGRSELARTIFGVDAIDQGQILIDGRVKSISSPRDALDNGIVLIPEDRKQEGLVMIQSIAFNITLPWVDEWISFCMPDWKKRRQIADRAIDDFGIKAADVELCIDSLSGGNQQKVVVSRWMEHRPKILILDEPTRGVDVGAREEMFSIICSLVNEGMAVAACSPISSDLSEVASVSNRLAIYRDGRILQTAKADEFTQEQVLGTTYRSWRQMKIVKQMLPLIMAMAGLLVLFALYVPNFLHVDNILDLIQQISVNAILAFGMTLVIVIGGIDLSVGALVALVGTTTVFVLTKASPDQQSPLCLIIAMLSGLSVAGCFGLFNGVWRGQNEDASLRLS